MRLATWNINGIRARLSYLLLWLEERKPDVVGLQELKISDAQFPFIELQAAGYHVVCHGQKSWNGVAILSRERGEVAQRGLPGCEVDGARLVTADVAGLSFSTVYVPNGKSILHPDFSLKLLWLDQLAAHFEAHVATERPAVLCGDFNLCPAPLDSWAEVQLGGGIFHTEEERRRFRRLLDLGFVDLYRARHPDQPGYTWWDYRAGAFHKGQGLRIDLMLGTPAIAERVLDVVPERDWRKKKDGLIPSDHAPVYVDLDW
jgi:exodeoxyribonuclease III